VRASTTIEQVDLLLVNLPPPVPRSDAIQSFVVQETPMVRITTADRLQGTGYAYTIGTGGSSVLALLKDHLAPRLLGRDAREVEGLWRELLFATHATSVGALTSLALAAIDTALWDLRCKRANEPLWRLAGGAQASVPVYTTEGGWLHHDTDTLVREAVAAREAGFQGAKLKVGKPHVSEDIARLRAVRQAVGDDFELLVDANQCFSLSEALRRAPRYADLGIGWLEEPLPADDLAGHVKLAQQAALPIAVGESLYSPGQFGDYLRAGACHVVQVDVARVGGITPWLKVAHAAEACNTAVAPHFLMELHVALCAAVPNAAWLEYIPQLDDVAASRVAIERGRARPSEVPGLGIDWKTDRIDTLAAQRHTLVRERNAGAAA
jgi:L-alanine-DL-glutamate epimerase-like enolase superfamily enzyme